MRPAQARVFALAGTAALAAAALAACGGGSDSGGDGDGELTWAVSSGWESWNENTADGNNSYLHQALTPSATRLGDFDQDAKWIFNDALLAKAPELASESPMTVTYTLNENAQWSDGEPFDGDDFTYLWYQLSGDAAKCDQAACLPASTDWGANVAAITQADNVVTMTYVDGYLDPEWQYFGEEFYPSHIAEANGFADWKTDPAVMGQSATWFGENPPTWGTGPYTPTDAVAGDYVAFEPNANYQGSTDPGLDKLTMKVVEGTESIITELRQGSIDGAWPSEFSQEELDKVAEDQAITTEVYEGSIWLHIDTNTNNEFLGDEVLRQAVFTAIDNADIIAKSYPDTEVMVRRNHFFNQQSEFFEDALGTTDPAQGSGDEAAANAALEAAGYTTGDTLMTPGGDPVSLVFRYGEGDATRTLIGELVQASLAEIGIDVTLTAIPDGELGTVLTEGDFGLVVFGWSGTPAFTTAPQQYFGSASSSNFGKYTLDGLDEAIAKVRSTTDIAESAQFTNDVEAMVMPAAFTLPLFDEPQSILYNNGVLGGVVPNGNSQAGPMWNIQEWKPA